MGVTIPWASGVYTRSNGTFTGATVWQQDAAVPVNIIASRHDTHDQDIATGLNNCVTIDGLNKPAATITPVADATYALGSTALRWTNLYLSSSTYLFNGATNAVQLVAGTLTAARAATFPDASGTVVLTGGTAAVMSIADATNGGLSFSASSGAVTAALNVNDLVAKASPVGADSVALYDVAGVATKKTTLTAVIALVGAGTSPVAGAQRNMKIVQASTTTATVSWDEVVAETALNGTAYKDGTFSGTLNFATTGANGLDIGALAASTFYSIYAIYNPGSTTWALMACTAAASNATIYGGAHMPSGYTASALIGVMLSDGSSHLLVTTQYDREVFYQTPVNIFTATTGPAGNTLTSQSIAAAVPAIAKKASGLLGQSSGGATIVQFGAAGDATGYGGQAGAMINTAGGTALTLWSFITVPFSFTGIPIITAQTIYWATGASTVATCRMSITGFSF